MVSDELHLPNTFSRDGENLVWTVRLGAHAYGNPTVADGRVFVGTDTEGAKDDPRFGKEHPGVVKCLSEKTGELLWQLWCRAKAWAARRFAFCASGYGHLFVSDRGWRSGLPDDDGRRDRLSGCQGNGGW